MELRRRILFYSVLVALPVLAINMGAAVVLRVGMGIWPFSREAVLERKADFIRSERPLFTPHPYLGAAETGDVGTGGTLSGTEPLYATRPTALPQGAVRVLVLGGSFAKHLSSNDDQPAMQSDGRTVGPSEILQQVLDAEFGAGRFVVFNAAMGGGKQPQQLFKLNYLHLLGESFGVVINLDGFNEIALPLVENIPFGTSAIQPRAYPALIRSASQDVSCVRRSNELARSFSRWPVLELISAARIRGCMQKVDLIPRAPAGAAVAGGKDALAGADPAMSPESIQELVTIWRRSSEEIEALARARGFAYLHVLQPNQYVLGAKPFTPEELMDAVGDSSYPYRLPIETQYSALQFGGMSVRNTLDLREVFRGNAETLYRDLCCHLNNRGVDLLARAIVRERRSVFESALTTKARSHEVYRSR